MYIFITLRYVIIFVRSPLIKIVRSATANACFLKFSQDKEKDWQLDLMTGVKGTAKIATITKKIKWPIDWK